MGTRGVINIEDGGSLLVSIYRQFDGYPLGLGKDIKNILGNPKILNGHHGERMPEAFNGMGCLSAYLVGNLKKSIGNIYIIRACNNPREDCGAEYLYNLYTNDSKLLISVYDLIDDGRLLYDGLLSEWEVPFDPIEESFK
jgi:hypothetical protein